MGDKMKELQKMREKEQKLQAELKECLVTNDLIRGQEAAVELRSLRCEIKALEAQMT